jgi:pyruvate/2-oxoglutarate dehydrogenase complex dihydrolipoamide dehydrogenase (E3) component
VAVQVDFPRVMARLAQVVRDIEPHDSVARYTALGVDVQRGAARIIDPWHVQITAADGTQQVLSTRSIVIATGARPVVPPLPGLADVGCLTSETLWGLRELPRRLLVLGGGPIGCELAQAFARLGSQVTLVEQGERLLLREDADVSAWIQQALETDGVVVLTGHQALRCSQVGDVKTLAAERGGRERSIEFDELLCAVGRVARLEGFGLEELGIPVARTVLTDDALRTVFPNILAAGDVAGPWQFTHTAAHQASYAAINGLFGSFKAFKVDPLALPRCTYTAPEVARVGLNVQEALTQGVAHEVTRYPLSELDRAITDGRTAGWVQVLTVPGRDRILGATIVGARAGDLLAEVVLAMQHGLGLNKILATVHSYPTMAEASRNAAGAWKRAHAPPALLRAAERFHAWRRG